MAQVPYNPVPQTPADIATPRLGVSADVNAFGGAVAQATQHLGQTIEGAGNELFTRAIAMQDLINRSAADEAATKYAIESGNLHAEFLSTRGQDSRDGLMAHNNKLAELRTTLGSDLNPAVRRLYDSETRSQMARSIFSAARHAGEENKRWLVNTSQAVIENKANNMAQHPDDEGMADGDLDTIRAHTIQQGHILGASPEMIERDVTKNVSNALLNRIVGLSRTAPLKATELLEQFRDRLDAKDILTADRMVQQQRNTTGARVISDQVNADLKDDPMGSGISLKDRLDEGRRIAEKHAPDDPTFKDFVEQRIATDYTRSRAVKRDLDNANIITMNWALMGGDKGGKFPTTVEELTADPKARAAWEQLDAKQQRSLLGALKRNAAGDVPMTTDRLKRWQTLKGLADQNPIEFLGTDIPNEDLPFSTKKELINLQQSKTRKGEGDPRVTHAIGVLGPQLQAAGIRRDDKDSWNQFVGSLQDSLEQFQRDHKKAPNAEEIRLLGSQMLQQRHTEQWMPWSKDFNFQQPIPKSVIDEINADPIWAEKGIVPTDEDRRRIFTRQQLNELYGKKATKPAPGAPNAEE